MHGRSQFPLQAGHLEIAVQVKVPQLVYGDMTGSSCLLSPQFAWLLSSRLPAKQVLCIVTIPGAALATLYALLPCTPYASLAILDNIAGFMVP